jgi:hypothetical protein
MADRFVKAVQEKMGYTPPSFKFGLRGDGKCEACHSITIWTRLIGKTSEEAWRFCVPSSTPLEHVRQLLEASVGHPINQDCFVDEMGYRFASNDLSKPVSTFSNNCKLHVDLTYDLHSHIKAGIESAANYLPSWSTNDTKSKL